MDIGVSPLDPGQKPELGPKQRRGPPQGVRVKHKPTLQDTGLPTRERPPLSDALIEGAIALHRLENCRERKGKRGPTFRVDTGIHTRVSITGRKKQRVTLHMTYAGNKKAKKRIKEEIIAASTRHSMWHVGFGGKAFWLLIDLPRKAFDELRRNIKGTIGKILYLLLLYWAVTHPELGTEILKFLKSIGS